MSMEFWVYLCTGLLMLVSAIHYGGIMGDANFKEKLVLGVSFWIIGGWIFCERWILLFCRKIVYGTFLDLQ